MDKQNIDVVNIKMREIHNMSEKIFLLQREVYFYIFFVSLLFFLNKKDQLIIRNIKR